MNISKIYPKPFMMEDYAPNNEIVGDYDSSLAVKCENGTFVGYMDNNILTFKGIPYATQPEGELRWRRPEPAAASAKVYEAYHSGKVSIQPPNMLDPDLVYPMGEACLYLNIYNNTTDKTAKKAVMVWIHGGAFLSGGNSSPNYDGFNFTNVNSDIILVCINYRMGVLGFADFSHIEGGEKYPDMNLGLYDQVEALRWVKKNIAAFGGDPERITIFGESAGAISISSLAVMKEAKGLFQRAICQSGSVSMCTPTVSTTLPADNLAKAFNAKNMDDLLAIPEDKLIEYWQTGSDDGYNFAAIDSITFGGRDPFELWEEGATKDLDILQGFMADEFTLFVAAFQPKPFFDVVLKDMADRVYACGNDKYKELYAEYQKHVSAIEEPGWEGIEFVNDLLFGSGCRRQATAHAKNGGRGYVYIMDKENDVPALKACHGTDIFYAFGNFDNKMVKEIPANRTVSEKIQRMWAAFAKTGDPSTEDLLWKQYDEKNHATAILGDNFHMENDPRSIRRQLTEQMIKENPAYCHGKSVSDMVFDAVEHYPQFKK